MVTSNEDNHTMRYPLGWLKSVSYSTEDLDEKSTQKDIKYKVVSTILSIFDKNMVRSPRFVGLSRMGN